jgi:hypothetical protein
MAHMQDPSAAQLLSDIQSDIDQWKSGEEIDFERKYEAPIRSIGAIPFLTKLFRGFEGSTLSGYLNALTFLWKDLPFSAWQEVLYGIADSTQAIYQFVWFAAPFLGLDVLSMIRTDPKVDDTAREFIRGEFPSGAPKAGGSWEREVLENSGVDPVALWRRLAAEGAPMKVDLSGLQ